MSVLVLALEVLSENVVKTSILSKNFYVEVIIYL